MVLFAIGAVAAGLLGLVACVRLRSDRGGPVMVTLGVQGLFVVSSLLVAQGARSGADIRVPTSISFVALPVLGFALLLTGAVAGSIVPIGRRRRIPYDPSRVVRLKLLTIGTISLTALYFVLGGVPLLGDDVLRDRWGQNNGFVVGFLEIINLYALPLTYVVLSLALSGLSENAAATSLRRYRQLVLITLFASRVAGGFRGQFLYTVLLLVLIDFVVEDGSVGRKILQRWRAILAALAVVVIINGVYQRQQASPDQSPLEVVVGRVFIRPGEDVAGVAFYGRDGVDLGHDLRVVSSRLVQRSPQADLTFNEALGAWQRRVLDPIEARRAGRILATTTPGGAQVALLVATPVGETLVVMLGFVLAWATRLARSGSINRRYLAIAVAFLCHEMVQRGNPVAQTLGWLTGIVVFSVGFRVCSMIEVALTRPRSHATSADEDAFAAPLL